MVHIRWKESVLALLIGNGITWAGPAAMAPPISRQPEVLTIAEPGQPEQSCRVLRVWRGENGQTQYQVQTLRTGAVTIISEGPASANSAQPPAPPVAPFAAPVPQNGIDQGAMEEHGLWARIKRLFRRGDSTPSMPEMQPVVSSQPPGLPMGPAAQNAFQLTPPAMSPLLANAFTPVHAESTTQAMPAPAPRPMPIVAATAVLPHRDEGTIADRLRGLPRAQVLAILRESVLPSLREMCLDTLASADWHADPNVIPAMIQTAQTDPAANVRAAAVRCLVRMDANTLPVRDALAKLTDDPAAIVRREVTNALVAFAPTEAAPTSGKIIPAGIR